MDDELKNISLPKIRDCTPGEDDLRLCSLCLHAVISVVKMEILNLLVCISNIIEMVWL